MKETKRRVEFFTFYDKTSIEKHLEKMAKRGWLLEKMSAFWWTYRRIEPKKIRFAVSYYAVISDFEPEPTEEQQSFVEFCDHSGWKLATSTVNMQIFYNEKEDPVPIETDPMLEVENVHKYVKKTVLCSYIMLLMLGLMMGMSFFNSLINDPIRLLSSAINLFTGVWSVIVCLYTLTELCGYFRWYRRAKKAAAQGEFPETHGRRWLLVGLTVFMVVSLVAYLISISDPAYKFYMAGYLLCLLTGFFAVNGIKRLLKRKKVSAGANKWLTFTASFALAFALVGATAFLTIYGLRNDLFDTEEDGLPFTIGELVGIDDSGYLKTYSEENSWMFAQTVSSQHSRYESDRPTVRYTVTEVKLPFLYDWCVETIYRQTDGREGLDSVYHYSEIDASPWNAKTAYQMQRDGEPIGQYLLCFEHTVLELSVDWEMTPEQMRIVGEKITAFYQ